MSVEETPRQAITRLNRIGLVLAVLLIGGFGGWSVATEIAGAVIASGSIVVESNVKKVQHPAGGIVGELLVREGDQVEAGQVVVRLDDTITRATLGMVRAQLDELLARQARLIAEREGVSRLEFPDELRGRTNEPTVSGSMADEEKLFESRRRARTGLRNQLRERVVQSNQEIVGLTAQMNAKEREIAFITEELVGVRDLWNKKLVSVSRMMVLERERVKLDGERGNYVAEIARARGKISETELQIIQLEQDFRTEVLKDLRDAQGKISELRERRVAAEDQLRRVDIRAPQSGIVHGLSVHTVGGVVANGETIMLIVPRGDALVIEAKVAPQDIDQIGDNAKAIVRIMAGNQRTMPDLSGTVVRISADLTRETSGPMAGMSYYTVRVALAPDELHKLGDFRLVPGMPAEAFIQTAARTPMGYLLKPLREQIERTFRER